MVRIKLSSIFVTDQEKALNFYTNILGLIKKTDLPAGEFRWLTVGNESNEFEMLLEPNAHPAAKTYQKAIFDDGIPATILFVNDIDAEYKKLKSVGVEFKNAPIKMGSVRLAVINDTCGNWVQLCQE